MARVVDLETAVDVLGGKVEFETGEEGRETEVLTHLLAHSRRPRRCASTSAARLRGSSSTPSRSGVDGDHRRAVTARDFLAGLPVLGESDLYDQVCDRLGAANDGERAGAIELALEGLYLARKIGKDSAGGETVYG